MDKCVIQDKTRQDKTRQYKTRRPLPAAARIYHCDCLGGRRERQGEEGEVEDKEPPVRGAVAVGKWNGDVGDVYVDT